MTYIDVIGGGGSSSGSTGTTTSSGDTVKVQGLTSNYNAVAADDGTWYHNLGASGVVRVVLPSAPAVGYSIGLLSAAPQSSSTMGFTPTGSDSLQVIESVTAANGVMGCAGSGRSKGCALRVTYVGSNLWTWSGGYPYDWHDQ